MLVSETLQHEGQVAKEQWETEMLRKPLVVSFHLCIVSPAIHSSVLFTVILNSKLSYEFQSAIKFTLFWSFYVDFCV